MKQAFIALGTNIEPREEHFNEALDLLSGHEEITIQRKSSIYETAPVGYTEQADFLNMVVEIETSLSSMKLLDTCQAIEKQLGREKTIRFGPRTIDLDILVYNNESEESERLTIPHPRMHERAFVLIPLGELAPNLLIPIRNKRVTDLINILPVSSRKGIVKWRSNEQ